MADPTPSAPAGPPATTPPAAPAAAPPAPAAAMARGQLRHPVLARANFGAFLAYALLTTLLPGHSSVLPSLVLAALLAGMALWFVLSVTGEAQAHLQDLYTFSYSLTLGAFTLLLMPLLSDHLPCVQCGHGAQPAARSEAALQLVRGCVRGDSASKLPGAGLSACPPLPAASGAASAPPAGQVGGAYRYTWLISIGGVTAQQLLPSACASASVQAAQAEAAASAAPAGASAAAAVEAARAARAARATWQQRQAVAQAACTSAAGCSGSTCGAAEPVLAVEGGLTVPLFVVVLALIGGAVSLSRRIPEYQRRNDEAYVPTDTEPYMPAFRVREAMVFQSLQLVSAPFLAVGSFHIIEPSTIAAAATLAFATGFFSETVLLMIRGAVTGLRPELTKVAGPASLNLVGRLVAAEGGAALGDCSGLRVELRPRKGGEWRNVPVEAAGQFAIGGVAAGRYDILVSGPGVATDTPVRDIDVDEKTNQLIDVPVKLA